MNAPDARRFRFIPWLASLAAGLAFVAAYPGVGAWMLGFVVLTPLYVVVRHRAAPAAAAYGCFTGFVAVLVGFHWLPAACQRFTGLPLWSCLGLHLGFAAYHSLQWGLAAGGARWLARGSLPLWLTWPSASVAAELVFPQIFPYTAAAILHEARPALQILDLLGAQGVVFLLALTNAAFGESYLSWRRRGPQPWRASATCASLWLASLAYAAFRLPQLERSGEHAPELRVGVVQANAGSQIKREQPHESLRRHIELSERLISSDPLDLLVWGETALSTPLFESRLEAALARRLAARADLHAPVPLVLGAVIREDSPRPGARQFNSALSLAADGQLCKRCRYDKQRRVPLGEYLPLASYFPSLPRLLPHAGSFAPGQHARALSIESRRMELDAAVFVCFEALSARLVRELVQSGSERGTPGLLINLTDDGWFGASPEPAIHLALSKLRSVEHRRFLVRAAQSGQSAIVDATGAVLHAAEAGEAAAFAKDVQILDVRSPYTSLGDRPWYAGFALLLLARLRPRANRP